MSAKNLYFLTNLLKRIFCMETQRQLMRKLKMLWIKQMQLKSLISCQKELTPELDKQEANYLEVKNNELL